MASFYEDIVESAAALTEARLLFEQDLRAGLKADLMRLAEERVDAIVDEAVKKLQTRVDGMRDMAAMRSLIQVTVRRIIDAPATPPSSG